MIPKMPARRQTELITQKEGFSTAVLSFAHIKRAGIVKIAPAARDSPAEPIVCTMLFSRMESRLRMILMIPMERTAAGIDAEIVIPTRSPRYEFAAPKSTASRIPIRIETGVISGRTLSEGMKGLKDFSSITFDNPLVYKIF